MTSEMRDCSDERLLALLDPASGETSAAAQHVGSCPRCQSRLEELAGSAAHWEEARELLSDDDTNRKLVAEARERSWSSAIHGASAQETKPAWTEAMARQLLGPPSHPEMLGRLGRYEIERLIGSGGMGIVFKAFDSELNRPVAIKVLAPHLAGNGAARQRFSREARAAAAVVHEHVVAIHNVESDGAAQHQPDAQARAPFLVMQFVAGESLQARLDRQGPLSVREILRIAHQTAAGLAAAHAQGLVHRDVKPSNILLEAGVERALLTDFGLARAADDASLTHTGYLPGTPHYMSPEQARGDAVDARSDLFSLGSVMYALCTGRPPFRADTSFGVLRRITDTQPRPIREINADIPGWLAALIDKLLAKEPTDRLATASATAELCKQCLAHVQQPDAVPLPAACVEICQDASRLRAWPGNFRGVEIALAFTLVLVLLAGAAAIFSGMIGSGDGNAQLSGAAAASSADLQWDAAAAELGALASDVNDLEQRTHELWDRSPTTTTPDLESMP